MNIKTLLGSITFIFLGVHTHLGYAQQSESQPQNDSPIPVELTTNLNGWTFQMVVDKKLNNCDHLGIFALSYLRGNYNNEPFLQESTNLALLKYELWKGFSVLSGALFNYHWGLRPYAGLQQT